MANVWSYIDRFRWRLDDLHTVISGDRLMAVGAAVFESIGYTEDGTPYDRPGRATVVSCSRRSLTECRDYSQHFRPRGPAPARAGHWPSAVRVITFSKHVRKDHGAGRTY